MLNRVQNKNFTETIKILRKANISKLSFSNSYDNEKGFLIDSSQGSVALYDCEDKIFINFTKLNIQSFSSKCKVIDDYVVFEYDNSNVKLHIEAVTETCELYDSLNLKSITKPAIILHKKYIKKLEIRNAFEYVYDVKPTESLILHISSLKRIKSALKKYL